MKCAELISNHKKEDEITLIQFNSSNSYVRSKVCNNYYTISSQMDMAMDCP